MANRCLRAIALCAVLAGVSSHAQTRTDEYTRYDLQPPATAAVKIIYEASAITEGARTFSDDIAATAKVSDVVVRDMMTGQPLKFLVSARSISVTLGRPVPPRGQGRVRIEKTVTDAKAYARVGDAGTFTVPSVRAGTISCCLQDTSSPRATSRSVCWQKTMGGRSSTS